MTTLYSTVPATRYFQTRTDAYRAAQDAANWSGVTFDVRAHEMVKITTRALMIRLLADKGWAESTKVIATIKPHRFGRVSRKKAMAKIERDRSPRERLGLQRGAM